MKNLKISALILVLGLGFMFPIGAKASTITNVNGVEITDAEYNSFIKMYSHERIMNMTEEEYEKALTYNYDNLISVKKYVLTTYNPSLGITTETELTEKEYEELPQLRLNSGSVSYETTAKLLTMIFASGSVWNHVIISASWKYIPTVRVFDVIGMYGDGFTVRNGSQVGHQMYVDAAGTYHSINYSWNGTNIVKYNDGYGISMNLVNPTIQSLALDTECDVSTNITHPGIYAAYEHAVNNSVTLAQSKNYTLGTAGLGGVFVYPYSISSKYDGMSGVHIYF